ncbi:unnamed protein product (mitochondrion) [Plasmodiophora brassicae]|uniref:PAP-associated domain-containing protein n=1 Tax=Plasmodiophora brassicae TaxID=37360 RepID=A0A3P3XZ00_PLABS|nr:unnamed protein product [Plasmodiophora brassicae]
MEDLSTMPADCLLYGWVAAKRTRRVTDAPLKAGRQIVGSARYGARATCAPPVAADYRRTGLSSLLAAEESCAPPSRLSCWSSSSATLPSDAGKTWSALPTIASTYRKPSNIWKQRDHRYAKLNTSCSTRTTYPSRSPTCQYGPNPPKFMSIFCRLERRLTAETTADLELITNLYESAHQALNDPERNAPEPHRSRRISHDTVAQLASVVQALLGNQGRRTTNLFTIRDANFVVLPVRRFWNATRVPVDDLTNAISETANQISASRSTLRQLNVDRLILYGVYTRVLGVSASVYSLSTDAVMSSDRTSSMASMMMDRVTLRVRVARVRLLVGQIEYMGTLYQDAVACLEQASKHIELSSSLASLDPLLSEELIRDDSSPSGINQRSRTRPVPGLEASAETSTSVSVQTDSSLTSADVQPIVETLGSAATNCNNPLPVDQGALEDYSDDIDLGDNQIVEEGAVTPADDILSSVPCITDQRGAPVQTSPILTVNDNACGSADSNAPISPMIFQDVLPGHSVQPLLMSDAHLEVDLVVFLEWVPVWRQRYNPVRYTVRRQVEEIVQTLFPRSLLLLKLSPVDDLYTQAPFTGLDLTISNRDLHGDALQYLSGLLGTIVQARDLFLSPAITLIPFPTLIVTVPDSPLILSLSWNTVLPNAFAKEAAAKYPMMRPVLLYVWVFLVRHGLHDLRQGGIDWQLLQIMVVSHIQVNADDCRPPFQGRCLRMFFHYYGARFNYHRDCISVVGDGRVFPKSDLSGSMWHDAFRLCAESPYDPAVDLGALASSIRTVVDKFKRASELLMDNVPGRLISEDMLGSYALPG